MIKLNKLNLRPLLFTAFSLSFSLVIFNTFSVAHADRFCVTDRCKKAEQDAIAAQISSEKNAKAAASLEEAIDNLNREIDTLHAAIHASEIRNDELAQNIKLTHAKLTSQQTALADILIDLHFSDSADAVSILANSKNLSDFTEKQARADTIKGQIANIAEEIKIAKQQLEEQKREVQRILLDQQNSLRVIDQKKAEQSALKEKYQSDASNFAANAEAARKVKAEEIAKEIARLNSTGAVGQGINSYPWRNSCPAINLAWSDNWGFVCQCVHYTGYKVKERWGINVSYWGNANTWDDYARARGYRVDTTPAPFTVAVNNSGTYGHVMWVESVNANGTIDLSEYNNAYSSRSGAWGDYGYRSNVNPAGLVFIHFE